MADEISQARGPEKSKSGPRVGLYFVSSCQPELTGAVPREVPVSDRWRIGSPAGLALLLLYSAAAPLGLAYQGGGRPEQYVIAGRVVDPHGLRPEGAILTLGQGENGSFSAGPVPIAEDGSFVTPRLRPGIYVLEIIRTPHSATHPATPVGLTIVPVSTADVPDVRVEVRRDTALTGRFRMESDNPDAP